MRKCLVHGVTDFTVPLGFQFFQFTPKLKNENTRKHTEKYSHENRNSLKLVFFGCANVCIPFQSYHHEQRLSREAQAARMYVKYVPKMQFL